MFGYSTTLRSLTQGRATYTMEFKHYTEAPKTVAEAVINRDSPDKRDILESNEESNQWPRANLSGRSRT